MRRKFELDNEVGSVDRLENKMARSEDWEEDIYKKHIEMVKLEKDDTGWRDVWLVLGQENMRLFSLRTGSPGLLENKKRCRIVSNESHVMCDCGIGRKWLISWWVMGNLREIGRCCWMMRAELCGPESDWMNWRVDEEGKVALLLGKGVDGVCNIVMEEMVQCIGWGRWW